MQRQTTTANIWIQEEYALGRGAGQGDRPTQVPGLLRKGRVAFEGWYMQVFSLGILLYDV